MTPALAFRWTKAKLGVTQAFTALGRFYAEGLGVKVDRDKALAYYLVAASSGDPLAKQKVDQLSAQMSPKQIATAKQTAAKLPGFTRSPVFLLKK
jgi:TPR repeat protein